MYERINALMYTRSEFVHYSVLLPDVSDRKPFKDRNGWLY